MNSEQEELNRLRWRSRRGMLELDLLLLPFFDEVYTDLEASQQLTFQRLLEQDDPDLWLWFSRKGKSEDAELQSLVEFILARVQPS
ncbi:MAG: succinate dehydrogenase assembly factor 2 [Pseudomonadales bacterium]|jgi:antitoxin CptB